MIYLLLTLVFIFSQANAYLITVEKSGSGAESETLDIPFDSIITYGDLFTIIANTSSQNVMADPRAIANLYEIDYRGLINIRRIRNRATPIDRAMMEIITCDMLYLKEVILDGSSRNQPYRLPRVDQALY